MSNSLSETFSKVNHVRHILMDVAMFTAAVGLVVSTGGVLGLLDPIGVFLNMHIPAMADLAAIGDFASNAFQSAAEGLFWTDAALMDPHSIHAAHGAAIGVDVDSGALSLPGEALNGLGWE